MDEPTLIGAAPDLMHLKRKYGKLSIVTIDRENDDGNIEELEFVFKQPDRKLMSAAAKMAKEDPLKSADVIIQNCLVAGPHEALDDLKTWLTVADQVQEMMKPYAARIKNF